MNIIILGGSGYLGTALAKYLSNFYKITLCTRKPSKLKYLKDTCTIVKTKNYSKKFLKKIIFNQNILINCTGITSNQLKINPNKKKIKDKILLNIIRACSDKNLRIIHFSSIQVYENYENKKIITEKSSVKGISNYTKSHLDCENILLRNKDNYHLTIIRLASVFGINFYQNYGEQKNNLLNRACNDAIQKKRIVIRNKNIARNFVPIKVFLIFMKRIINFDKKFIIVNLGYKTYSLSQVSKIISKYYGNITKKKLDINFQKNKKIVNKKFKYLSNFIKIKFKKKIFEDEIKNTLKLYLMNYENKK